MGQKIAWIVAVALAAGVCLLLWRVMPGYGWAEWDGLHWQMVASDWPVLWRAWPVAMVGGLAGVVVVAAGASHVAWGFNDLLHGHLSGVAKVVVALILSPIIGFWVGFILHRIMMGLLRGARPSIPRCAALALRITL